MFFIKIAKLFTWANTFDPVIALAFPYSDKIFWTEFLSKKLLIVGIALVLAILHILEAGSIPTIFNLCFLKVLNKTPVLLPISTTRSLLFKLYSWIVDIQQRDVHGGSIRIFISCIGNYKVKQSVTKICKMENKAKLNSKKTLNHLQKKVMQNRSQLTAI